MNKKKTGLNAILILILVVLIGYSFFYFKKPTPRIASETKSVEKKNKPQRTSAAVGTAPTNDSTQGSQGTLLPESKESAPVMAKAGSELVLSETSYDSTTATAPQVLFRNIGSRDLFTPLIMPPPPPKPRERGVNELTINWVLEEIVSPTQVIISDTRRDLHEVVTGDEVGEIKIGGIEPDANRVELIYKDESKWLTLQDIETVTRGWKVDGVSPDTKEAYVFVERAGGSQTLSEGTTFQHIKLEKVLDDGVVLRYGTQEKTLKMAGT